MIPVEQFVTRRLVHDGGSASDLRSHRGAMGGVFVLAILVGGGFVAATLDLFFDGNAWWIAIAVVLLINRSVLAMAPADTSLVVGGSCRTVSLPSLRARCFSFWEVSRLWPPRARWGLAWQ